MPEHLDFDTGLHHIGLREADDATPARGFLIAGSYSRAFRRQVQSEFDGVRYGGGDSLVNKPGLSSWTQDDWTGGVFHYVWGKDEAGFAKSYNALPSQFDRSLRSVPQLQQWMGGKRLTTTENPLLVVPYGGYVHAVFKTAVHRWTMANGTASSTSPGHAGTGIHSAWIHRDGGIVYHARDIEIARLKLSTFTTFEDSWVTPVTSEGFVRGGSADGDRVTMAIDDVLWVVNIPDDHSQVPALADWTRIGRLPGHWVASCVSSGLTYILLAGDDQQSSLVAFDGTQILPICTFPFNFVGQSLCSYGGRLYVGGTGADIQTGAPRYAELFEVTGASVRLLKTFAPETRQNEAWIANAVPTMVVHEGLLFFGLRGLGLQAYDLTTDSFYGASIFSPNDAAAEIRHLVGARDNLFAWVYPITAHSGDSGWYRPATSQETVTPYSTRVETSDLAVAFDRKKRWKQLRVLSRYVTGTLTADYSVDGGTTWTPLQAVTPESAGKFQLWSIPLEGAIQVPESRTIRFAFWLPSGTDVAAFRELVAFTTSFRMLESDSVGTGEQEKLAWTFVLVGSETVEALDGSTLTQNLSDIHDTLWSWARGRKKLDYFDTDGTSYTVEIDDLRETVPFVRPPVTDDDPATYDNLRDREAFYQITLVEV